MKTLEDHNRQRTEQYRNLNSNEPRLNGIKCPDCGAELYDSCPTLTLASSPPQKNTMCKNCEYTGYRVA